jgi:hypothetical protein
MPINALGIDADSEPTTLKPPMQYRNNTLYPALRWLGFVLQLCQRANATLGCAAPIAALPEVAYITGEGHGDQDTFRGQNDLAVFHVGDYNANEVSGKIIHFLACQAAVNLGPDFIGNGCRAFIGYAGIFTFSTLVPNVFFECDSEIDLAFAEGKTAEEVFKCVQDLVETRVQELLDDPETVQAAGQLQEVFASLTRLGDRTAKLS